MLETRHPSPCHKQVYGSASVTIPNPLPPSSGIGLKPQHYRAALDPSLADTLSSRDGPPFRPGWFEVHPQNYFCRGGPPHRWLEAICRDFPVSFHSVGLSLGSAEGLNGEELANLRHLSERFQPAAISDHMSWSGTADNRYPDLLPLPYTRECLDHIAMQVEHAQDALRRPIMIENPSRYLAFASDEMDEAEFLHALCRKAGCNILFDINNVEVSATNLGLDPIAMVDAIDATLVGEVHLAGHSVENLEDGPFLIDDHGSAVSALTWELFERFIGRAGRRPVLIEWDTDIPEFAVLSGEAEKAQAIMSAAEFSHAA